MILKDFTIPLIIFMDSFIPDKNDENWLKNLRIEMQKVYDDELANNTSNR